MILASPAGRGAGDALRRALTRAGIAGVRHMEASAESLAAALASAESLAGAESLAAALAGAESLSSTARAGTGPVLANPVVLVIDADPDREPPAVDASGRLVDRDGVWAVGPGVRTALGLRLTDDPDRLALALAGHRQGSRALTRADLRVTGDRAAFVGGDPDPEADDEAQDVDAVALADTATGLRVRWRLAGGQVLGVAAEGPVDAVRSIAGAWEADLGPAEVRELLTVPGAAHNGPIAASPGLCVASVSADGALRRP